MTTADGTRVTAEDFLSAEAAHSDAKADDGGCSSASELQWLDQVSGKAGADASGVTLSYVLRRKVVGGEVQEGEAYVAALTAAADAPEGFRIASIVPQR